TIIDDQLPTIVAPANKNVTTDAGKCYATVDIGTATATDNCSYVVSNTAPANRQFTVGAHTVTWTVVDAGNNTVTTTQTITVTDNEKPAVYTKNISKQLSGINGLVTIIPGEVNNGSTDNCGVFTMTVTPNTFNCTHLGANTVTLVVEDVHGNINTATAIVTVTAMQTTTTVSVIPSAQQYSDPVTFTATLQPGTVPGGCTPAKTVTFKVANQVMGTVSLSVNSSTGNLEGTLTKALYEIPNSSELSPGDKIVTAVFNGTGAAFIVNSATTSLTITKEDARVTYTGSLFASTSAITSGQAVVTLAATIEDITATSDAAGDTHAGNILKARIKFINADNGTDISGWLIPGLIDPLDSTIGTVTFNWNANIGTANSISYTVGLVVGGYYQRNSPEDETVVTISKPLPDFVTGGGYLLLQSSTGYKAGDVGSKNNFGFNVKYNKSVRNLQGSINTIIRRTEEDGVHVYQVKGNAMTSLVINPTISSDHPHLTSIFDGKASIQDVTDPLNVVAVDGNATLHVEMTDIGEQGSANQQNLSDSIAITVWNKDGGLWFASNWSTNKTVQQAIAAGNIKIYSASAQPPEPPVTPGATEVILTSSDPICPVGTLVTFKAVINESNPATPTGKVTFYDENTILKAVTLTTVNGVTSASFATSKLGAGVHTITAVYSGDRIFKASTATILQTVGTSYVNRKMVPSTLEVSVYPNPSSGDFSLVIRSTNDKPVSIRVIDILGRVIEQRSKIVPNNIVRVGVLYRPGTYFAEVRQEKKKVSVQLIKQPY
ncbi:MAG: Ig-like domain repeat protein, partial [Candidatus Dadabacteria bacterium]